MCQHNDSNKGRPPSKCELFHTLVMYRSQQLPTKCRTSGGKDRIAVAKKRAVATRSRAVRAFALTARLLLVAFFSLHFGPFQTKTQIGGEPVRVYLNRNGERRSTWPAVKTQITSKPRTPKPFFEAFRSSKGREPRFAQIWPVPYQTLLNEAQNRGQPSKPSSNLKTSNPKTSKPDSCDPALKGGTPDLHRFGPFRIKFY